MVASPAEGLKAGWNEGVQSSGANRACGHVSKSHELRILKASGRRVCPFACGDADLEQGSRVTRQLPNHFPSGFSSSLGIPHSTRQEKANP